MANKIYFTEVILLTKSHNIQDFKDWIKWHLDIVGFNHCHVFDNESIVDIKSVCDSYGDRVTYEKVVGWPNQYGLYDRYINKESRSWWVLPIDDDEFFYVSDKYNNNVNTFLLNFIKEHPKNRKISVGWLNLISFNMIESRGPEERIVEQNTYYDHNATSIWQSGDIQVKTMVNTVCHFEYVNHFSRHNPLCVETKEESITIRGEKMSTQYQSKPTEPTDDIILVHYQFKTKSEWENKCKAGSPGSKKFDTQKKKGVGIFPSIWRNGNKSFKSFTKIKDILCK